MSLLVYHQPLFSVVRFLCTLIYLRQKYPCFFVQRFAGEMAMLDTTPYLTVAVIYVSRGTF
jgi:hypothetical protein